MTLKGYRTVAFMGAAAFLPALDALLPILMLPEWADVIPSEWWPYYSIAVGILGIVLRAVTTTPLGQRE
jgi:hypothetical protein